MSEFEASRLVAMAWGVAAAPQRGPKRELSHERIVEAAIEVADAEGLTAVTMQRVARSFGFSTMALYRYVASKDELHQLMLDAVVDSRDWVLEDEDWKTGLRQWAQILHDAYALHPWALDIPLHPDIMLMPGQVRGADSGLRALRTLPGPLEGKLLVISVLAAHVRGFAALGRDMGGSPPGGSAPNRQLLREIADEGRLPDIGPLIRSGAYFGELDEGDEEEEEDDHSLSLALLLPGIERFVEQADADAEDEQARAPGTSESALRLAERELEHTSSLRKATQKRVRELEKREARARAQRDRAKVTAKAAAKERARADAEG